jgi:capsular polysaccharide biosynthesis protein
MMDKDNRSIIIPKKYLNVPYIRDSLDLFPQRNFVFLDDKKLYRIKNSFFVSPQGKPYQFNPPLMQSLRQFLLEKMGLPENGSNGGGRKMYISRRKARKRKIINEKEVQCVLEDFGFETFYMEELSLKEQITLSNQSSIIAGIHGAGLTNTIFGRDESILLELQRYLNWPSCYYRLANALERKYYYLFCKHLPDENKSENADIMVDLKRLDLLLSSLCEAEGINLKK